MFFGFLFTFLSGFSTIFWKRAMGYGILSYIFTLTGCTAEFFIAIALFFLGYGDMSGLSYGLFGLILLIASFYVIGGQISQYVYKKEYKLLRGLHGKYYLWRSLARKI